MMAGRLHCDVPGMLIGQVDEVGVDRDGVRRQTSYARQLLRQNVPAGAEIERVERVIDVVIEIHHLIW